MSDPLKLEHVKEKNVINTFGDLGKISRLISGPNQNPR
jgi:hypothetical protein